MSGAWSNDQLNEIFVYSATTGVLILRVDQDGIYYYNVANGSYFKVSISEYPDDVGAVAAFFQPGESSIPGVVYDKPGKITGGEFITSTPGKVVPELDLLSPSSTGKLQAEIFLAGQSNLSAVDDSSISLNAAFINGLSGNEIGQGTFDEGGGTGYDSDDFTTTQIAADYISELYGEMVATRRYRACWSGTAQSSTSGDRIGLRIYIGPNNNNLTGATLLVDYGQIAVPASNTPTPFHVECGFNGQPGQNLLLGARRASGSGTCFLTTNYRVGEDTVGAYNP